MTLSFFRIKCFVAEKTGMIAEKTGKTAEIFFLKKPSGRPEKKKSQKINTGFVAEKNGFVAEKNGKTAEKVCFIAEKNKAIFL
jgi:hypothetical protein